MKTIISGYPNLKKYTLKEQLDYVQPPLEMLQLLMEYIPTHICVGTIWNKCHLMEVDESVKLRAKCKEYRKLILAFDFMGCITFVLNNEVIVVRIYYNEDDEQKSIEFIESTLVNYEYEFKD